MDILKIKNLEKSFGDNKVLKGIDLNASQGDVISIIGSSLNNHLNYLLTF